MPAVNDEPVTKFGDVWLLGRDKLLCGDAQVADNFTKQMGTERADLVFIDPPSNVRINDIRSEELAMRPTVTCEIVVPAISNSRAGH